MRAKLQAMDGRRNPNAAVADWREMVDAIRHVAAASLQPALCAALGLLPLRTALWASAAVASLGAALAALSLLYADLCAPVAEYAPKHQPTQP